MFQGFDVFNFCEMESQARQLENAIQEIDRVKRKLQQNVSEVKLQVQTAVSRNLEALRNREVWLLNQVELLQSAKEEVLNNQQAKLHKLLGVIQTQKGGITQARIDPNDLKPEESPYLTFRCEAGLLRENINRFGKIDASGLPHSVFIQPGNPSTSLPRHVEEYDDADHHILYKTVEEVQQARAPSSQIDVKIPKLSPSVNDWLARSSTITNTSESASKFTMPKLSNKKDDWLQQTTDSRSLGSVYSATNSVTSIMSGHTSSLTSSLSVPSLTSQGTFSSTQSWLKQIKQDLEDEDDFEIVESGGSCGSPEVDMEFHRDYVISPAHSSPNLLQWKYKPSSTVWLKTSSSPSSTHSKTHDVFQHYFATVSQDTKHWLAKKTESCCSQACQSKKPLDIENLGSCLGHEHPKVSDFTWLCTATETCTDMKECATDPSCLDKFLQKNPVCKLTPVTAIPSKIQKTYTGPVDTNTWLLKPGNSNPINSSMTNPFDKYLTNTSQNISDWLKPVSSKKDSQEGISFKHFDKKLSTWIKVPGKLKEDKSVPETQKIVIPTLASIDNQDWLMQKPAVSTWLSAPGKQNEKTSLFQNFHKNNPEWLMKPTQSVKS
ncbi:nuclear receptor coactivator 4-like isoform X2 [Ostrea edulis]|uniref:nuclear receptor coactivator 4-like isoform X2 n=1 Tax=Ostrea edulis TaxID=37623 RepID=UPI0024AE91E1|nr:nuclear receptor coactivator 4-like isoform X2 [Ostrea edulis]